MIDHTKDNAWDEFGFQYYRNLEAVLSNPPEGFKVYRSGLRRDFGQHPYRRPDYEHTFATQMLAEFKPEHLLNIGCNRYFIVGLLASFKITSIDIRPVRDAGLPELVNETLLHCDAKELDLESESFDAVVSLCSIEHFGLTRYGDEFDLDADKKAVKEMRRVLKPGGVLIFSVPLNGVEASIWFNNRRGYTYENIQAFTEGMELVDEGLFSMQKRKTIPMDEVVTNLSWDLYCGCWRKAA